MVTTPAVLTPDMAAMTAQMTITDIARPPFIGPNHWCRAAKRSSAIPDLSSTAAKKINRGTAIITK